MLFVVGFVCLSPLCRLYEAEHLCLCGLAQAHESILNIIFLGTSISTCVCMNIICAGICVAQGRWIPLPTDSERAWRLGCEAFLAEGADLHAADAGSRSESVGGQEQNGSTYHVTETSRCVALSTYVAPPAICVCNPKAVSDLLGEGVPSARNPEIGPLICLCIKGSQDDPKLFGLSFWLTQPFFSRSSCESCFSPFSWQLNFISLRLTVFDPRVLVCMFWLWDFDPVDGIWVQNSATRRPQVLDFGSS